MYATSDRWRRPGSGMGGWDVRAPVPGSMPPEAVDARECVGRLCGERTGAYVSENQNLLAEQRRTLILDEVRRRGGVRVNELTRRLGVSDMTVRRDLDALARQGVLEKVHGGAVPVVEASTHEPGFEAKSGLELTAKEDIARAAAELVPPGAAIALSGGTTTFALAHRLTDVPDLTVVTNSVRVADVFHAAQRSSGSRRGRRRSS